MTIAILMPALSPTMTEGTLAKWLVKVGDPIKSGMVIAEIETDKATMEVEAVEEGIMQEILIPAGTAGVLVNTTIATISGDDEAAPNPTPNPTPNPAPTPSATALVAPAVIAQAPLAPAPSNNNAGNRVFISPLARRIAQDKNLDISKIQGSGPKGRIIRDDVEGLQASSHAPVIAPAPSPIIAPIAQNPAKTTNAPSTNPFEPEFEIQPLSTMRKVIASRLSESKQNIPHFYLSVDVEIDALLAFRARLNTKPEATWKISVNDFVIKALAMALRKVPQANSSFDGNSVKIYKSIDIAVAVAIDGGLITPVVRGADNKGIASISDEMKNLASKAKAGKLQPQEFQGGTISISNLGMFGIKNFQAVINPPQAAILAVGAGVPSAVVKNGALAMATIMNLTLSVDHRAIDGSVGAELLKFVKIYCEDPELMFL